jgi:hypothetical protein
MVFARSAAMGFNRYVDRDIDAKNERTVNREIPAGIISGKAALRSWWADAFDRLPNLAYLEISLTADEHKVFMEYLRVVPGEQEMNVAELLVIEDGLIVSSRVYHG